MIIAGRLPRETLLAQSGATLVAAVNTGDPTNSVVPFRRVGEVARLMGRYTDDRVAKFHRYAAVTMVGCFVDKDAAEAVVSTTEDALRRNPAPGVEETAPIGATPKQEYVYIFSVIGLGNITTRWDDVSRSVINETMPDHAMRDGFVIRQVAQVDRSVFITTFGGGINTGSARSWANGTFGGGGFWSMDRAISYKLRMAQGFLDEDLPAPAGADSAYDPQPTIMYGP